MKKLTCMKVIKSKMIGLIGDRDGTIRVIDLSVNLVHILPGLINF